LSLRKTILEALEFKPEIDAAHIGVAVDNGVVTLSGHVNSYGFLLEPIRLGFCG
jgi:osmotically-inducible protein OsmY